jgi:hypothetical protein
MLTFTILFPSVVKLTHSFNHHNHQQVCDEDINHSTHFHKSDLDCDFYKFQLTKIQFFNCYDQTDKLEIVEFRFDTHYYFSYHNNQQLTRFLRGPPQLV